MYSSPINGQPTPSQLSSKSGSAISALELVSAPVSGISSANGKFRVSTCSTAASTGTEVPSSLAATPGAGCNEGGGFGAEAFFAKTLLGAAGAGCCGGAAGDLVGSMLLIAFATMAAAAARSRMSRRRSLSPPSCTSRRRLLWPSRRCLRPKPLSLALGSSASEPEATARSTARLRLDRAGLLSRTSPLT